MTRAPSSGGKSRLVPHLSSERLASLGAALAADALSVAVASGFPVQAYVTPPDGLDEVRAIVPGLECRPQQGGDLGARMSNAIADVLQSGFEAAMVIGTDVPLLLARDLTAAAELIDDGVVVLGPATDGGYYLVGTSREVPTLFENIEWGTGHVCRDTILRAEAQGLDIALLRQLTDLDTPADLDLIRAELASAAPDAAPSLRRWYHGETQRRWPQRR